MTQNSVNSFYSIFNGNTFNAKMIYLLIRATLNGVRKSLLLTLRHRSHPGCPRHRVMAHRTNESVRWRTTHEHECVYAWLLRNGSQIALHSHTKHRNLTRFHKQRCRYKSIECHIQNGTVQLIDFESRIKLEANPHEKSSSEKWSTRTRRIHVDERAKMWKMWRALNAHAKM